jgi:hypothetical protein
MGPGLLFIVTSPNIATGSVYDHPWTLKFKEEGDTSPAPGSCRIDYLILITSRGQPQAINLPKNTSGGSR